MNTEIASAPIASIIETEYEPYESPLDNKESVQFVNYEDGFMVGPKSVVTNVVIPGVYTVNYTREGVFFKKQRIIVDDYITLLEDDQTLLMNEIISFQKKAPLFRKHGVIHKRGILLYGPPGCGKTSFIMKVLSDFVKTEGIVFYLKDPGNFEALIEGLKSIKAITPNLPLLIVIEEIDKCQEHGGELLLSFLDGQHSLPNVIVLGTTNDIANMSPALLRPSRFDWIIEFKHIGLEKRKLYLSKKGIEGDELETWCKDTDKFTVAMLKELFIAVKLLDNTYSVALNKIKDNEKHQTKSTFKPKIGFSK